MQLGLRALEDGDLVDLVVAGQPRRDEVGVAVVEGRLGPLGRVEVEDVDEHVLHEPDVLGEDQRVVEGGDADADEVPREGVRVVRCV